MLICINCGSPQAKRLGNDFSCPTCGYEWDVAHEQSMRAYLASQGRQPAKPMDETAESEDVTEAQNKRPPKRGKSKDDDVDVPESEDEDQG